MTTRYEMTVDELSKLEACPRCTETARRAAELLAVHDRTFGPGARRG